MNSDRPIRHKEGAEFVENQILPQRIDLRCADNLSFQQPLAYEVQSKHMSRFTSPNTNIS